ncbi:unnamed protein product [Tetraodon nigroviridis]|uniref:(spotted green pufferfish) hypothetical protein n=1 Tax=Tetraodon nigroviridis TaxID=99883 RepID=Q4S0L3_TETNG|nr:unnamed protein product [Tetraodon nigroviridis]
MWCFHEAELFFYQYSCRKCSEMSQLFAEGLKAYVTHASVEPSSLLPLERSIVRTLLNITPPLPRSGGGLTHTLPANGRIRPPPAGCEQTNKVQEFGSEPLLHEHHPSEMSRHAAGGVVTPSK